MRNATPGDHEPRTNVLLLGSASPFWTNLAAALRAHSDFEISEMPNARYRSAPFLPEVILVEAGSEDFPEPEYRHGDDEPLPPRVLAFADEPAPVYRHEVRGVLGKNRPAREIAAAIRLVAGGYWLFVPPEPPAGSGETQENGFSVDRAALEQLSEREIDVLRLIAGGYDNAEISGELFLSISTVKSHVRRLFGKLDISNRTQAVIYAYEGGVIDPASR